MPLRSDQKALMFLGAVVVLGAGVRVVRASSNAPAQASQPALERQARAADSAAAADRERRSARGKRGARTRAGRSSASAQEGSYGSGDSTKAPRHSQAPSEDRAHVRGKLDLDVATAAQIDSLPGVTPLMARRIAADRVRRGPFLNLNGLRRVTGAGDQFLRKIDTLVVFSGTIAHAEPSDTVIKPRRRRR